MFIKISVVSINQNTERKIIHHKSKLRMINLVIYYYRSFSFQILYYPGKFSDK